MATDSTTELVTGASTSDTGAAGLKQASDPRAPLASAQQDSRIPSAIPGNGLEM